MLLPVLIGTWVPDWDLFLGIGFHRSALTHSALPVVLLAYAVRSYSNFVVPVGFGLGVASHLVWDVKEYGNVHWIPDGLGDRLFLLLNAGGIILWVWFKERPAPKEKD